MAMNSDALPSVMTTAEARRRGVLALLRNGTYVRVTRAVYVVAGVDPEHPDVRIAVAAAGLPAGVVIGGWAAARLHERGRTGKRDDATYFDGLDRSGRVHQPVLLLSDRATRLVATPYRRLVRSGVPVEERQRIGRRLVTSPMRTAFDLARLSTREDAVVGLDRLRALGLVDPWGLKQMFDDRPRWWGVDRARRALALSADGVESPQESVMRLVWREARLPVPVCNATILDDTGDVVARVDLLDTGVGLVGEYDGAVHASARRRSADAARQERLEALGLIVVRATAEDMSTERGRAAWRVRLRQAYERARASGGPGRWSVR